MLHDGLQSGDYPMLRLAKRFSSPSLSLSLLFSLLLGTPINSFANEESSSNKTTQTAPYHSFTGQISKNKVRMRLQPSLESPILRELNKGDLLLVSNEMEDFYAVQAPNDLKGYIFRTYVLDNVVEGNKVNVRLEPNVDAPIIAQLNSGDKVEGSVSPLNSKWLEINVPNNVYFYVAKDYVSNVGDSQYIHKLETRKNKASSLLADAKEQAYFELSKNYESMNLDNALYSLNQIVQGYQDLPEKVQEAKEVIQHIQDDYLKKKIAYLENVNHVGTKEQKVNPSKNVQEVNDRGNQFIKSSSSMSGAMSLWVPAENNYYENWLKNNPNKTEDEFYNLQKENAIVIKGVVEPYQRVVKNRPGDYMLMQQDTNAPIAYLYSTKVNLEKFVGKKVSLQVAERPNHAFAFPAYFVLSAE